MRHFSKVPKIAIFTDYAKRVKGKKIDKQWPIVYFKSTCMQVRALSN